MTYQEMLAALTEENAARREGWDETVTLRRQGVADVADERLTRFTYAPIPNALPGLMLHYMHVFPVLPMTVGFALEERWGNEPGDEDSTDWVIVERVCL